MQQATAGQTGQVVRVPTRRERTLLAWMLEQHRGHKQCDIAELAELAAALLEYYDSAEQPGGQRNPIALRGVELLRDLAAAPPSGETSYMALGANTRAELMRLAGVLEAATDE